MQAVNTNIYGKGTRCPVTCYTCLNSRQLMYIMSVPPLEMGHQMLTIMLLTYISSFIDADKIGWTYKNLFSFNAHLSTVYICWIDFHVSLRIISLDRASCHTDSYTHKNWNASQLYPSLWTNILNRTKSILNMIHILVHFPSVLYLFILIYVSPLRPTKIRLIIYIQWLKL